MSTPGLRELVRHHIEDIWAVGDREALLAVYHPDVIDHAPAPGQAQGVAGLVEVIDAFTTGLPDLTMTLEDVVVEGDLDDGIGVDRWTLRATHLGDFLDVPASGRTVEFRGQDVLRVRGGLITEVWHTEDLAGALRQLR